MEYFSTDQQGITLVNPSREERLRLLQSVLSDEEADFPEVYLTGKLGIVIGYRADGCLLWEEDGEVTRVLPHADVQSAMRAWNMLVAGDRDGLESLDWRRID